MDKDNEDMFFEMVKEDAALLGFSSLQKCTATIWCLAYGLPADVLNDYLRMSESTAVEATYRFCKAVVKVFGKQYLRTPKCSVILEAVADYDLWIWHAFFGTAGVRNDINVLQRSPVFKKLCDGLTPPYNYVINGHEYDKGY